MDQFVVFITNHWILASLFVVVLVALLINEWIGRQFGLPEVNPEVAVQMMNRTEAQIFDIRGESAFQSGHILGSHTVPRQSLEKKIAVLMQYADKPVIVVGSLDQETSKVGQELQQKGFKQLSILRGGIPAWTRAGLPLVKS